MEILALLLGKLAMYVGLFFVLNRWCHFGAGVDVIWAGVYRFLLGLFAVAMVFAIRGLLLNLGTEGDNQLVFVDSLTTGLIWAFRLLAWALATSIAYPQTKLLGIKMGTVVGFGLLLNFVIDLVLWLDDLRGRGGSFAPSFGEWHLGLC